jgi:hypothetical protein
MENNSEILTNPVEPEVSFELGQWIGRRQAFGMMAGKTAAAAIECLRRIRDDKLYRAKGVDWSGFCQKYAGMDRSYADRLIRRYEEFGPNYFSLSEIMRISPEAYRQIAGAVGDDGLAFGDQKIPISPENSHQIVDAVNALREQYCHADETPPKKRETAIAAARRRLEESIAELVYLFAGKLEPPEREELTNAVSAGLLDLKLLTFSFEP